MAHKTIDPLVPVPEAAYQLGISIHTIRSWIWQKRIESVRVGRAVRIRQSAIDAVVEHGLVPADARVAVA